MSFRGLFGIFEVCSCCLLCLETTQLCFVRKYIFLLLFLFLDQPTHPTNIRTLCILKYKNVRMSSDLWPPNNPCSPATNWGLSMVSGSQLQVAKLAQMCPAAPSSIQQLPAAPSGNKQCSAASTSGQRKPESKPGPEPVPEPVPEPPCRNLRAGTRAKTRAKTRMEHLGAPNVLLNYVHLKIRRVKTSSSFHQNGI